MGLLNHCQLGIGYFKKMCYYATKTITISVVDIIFRLKITFMFG